MKDKNYYFSLLEKAVNEIPYSNDPPELYEPIKYILTIGGKRVRPLITLISVDFFGGDVEKAVVPAIGLEIFHNFTLVHDDIMDHADTRRGHPCVHKKWNINRAILSGDAMLMIANTHMLKVDDDILREVMVLYNYYGLKVCEGQQYDLNFEERETVSMEEYMKMIYLKTAALMAAAFRLGAVLARAPQKDKDLFEQFGYNLGMAFQIEDDFLDTFGDYEKFGKKIGGDILENKKTFLLVKALEIADPETQKELMTWYSGNNFDPQKKIDAVKEIFSRLNIEKYCNEMADEYLNKSLKYLDEIDVVPENKNYLKEFARNLVKRDY